MKIDAVGRTGHDRRRESDHGFVRPRENAIGQRAADIVPGRLEVGTPTNEIAECVGKLSSVEIRYLR